MGLFGTMARDIASNVASDKISKYLPFKKGGGVRGHRARVPGKKLRKVKTYKKGGRVKRKGAPVRR